MSYEVPYKLIHKSVESIVNSRAGMSNPKQAYTKRRIIAELTGYFIDVVDDYLNQVDKDFFMNDSDWEESYLVSPILEAKYEALDIDEVVNNQRHLSDQQRDKLISLMFKHRKLFNGTLGCYPHQKVHLDIDPAAMPVHARVYSIPPVHEEVF